MPRKPATILFRALFGISSCFSLEDVEGVIAETQRRDGECTPTCGATVAGDVAADSEGLTTSNSIWGKDGDVTGDSEGTANELTSSNMTSLTSKVSCSISFSWQTASKSDGRVMLLGREGRVRIRTAKGGSSEFAEIVERRGEVLTLPEVIIFENWMIQKLIFFEIA